MACLDGGTKKDLLNGLVYWLSRPYAFALLAAFLLVPSTRMARALESGADFLNIGAGARASGLGSAYTALADDANAVYYNPGGLALARREVSLMHASWALDGGYDFAAAALPAGPFTAAISFTRLDHGELEGRAADGAGAGGFSAADKAVGVALARNLGAFSLGGGVKYVSSYIAGYSASAVAFDLGAMARLRSAPVTLGLAARNLGAGLKYAERREPLPLSLNAGAAWAVLPSVNLAAEVGRLVRDRVTTFSVGTEYALGALALRGGYAAGAAGGDGAMCGGLGFKAGSMKLDYSFSPFGSLDTTRRFSLSMAF